VPLKWISILLLVLLPVFQVPNWCIEQNLYEKGFHKEHCDPEHYPNSQFPKFPPEVSTSLNLLAYSLLCIFIIMRLYIKKLSMSAVVRSCIMFVIMLLAVADMFWVLLDDKRTTSWLVPIMNVSLLIFFVRTIREVWIQFSQVMVSSVPVFVIILAYFVIFVIVGFIFFANNEQNLAFSTINEAMYSVFILWTASNYPDIEMAYFK